MLHIGNPVLFFEVFIGLSSLVDNFSKLCGQVALLLPLFELFFSQIVTFLRHDLEHFSNGDAIWKLYLLNFGSFLTELTFASVVSFELC